MCRSVRLKPLYLLFLQEPSTEALQLQAASVIAAAGIPGMKITLACAAQQARLALQLEARNNKKIGEEKNDNENELLVFLVFAFLLFDFLDELFWSVLSVWPVGRMCLMGHQQHFHDSMIP